MFVKRSAWPFLAALLLLPFAFDPAASGNFGVAKFAWVWTLGVLSLVLLVGVKRPVRRTWAPYALLFAAPYLLATLFSRVPGVAFWGSRNRWLGATFWLALGAVAAGYLRPALAGDRPTWRQQTAQMRLFLGAALWLLAGVTILQKFGCWPGLVACGHWQPGKAVATLGNAAYLGATAVALLPWLLGEIVAAPDRPTRRRFGFLSALAFLLLFLAGARTAWGALVVAILYLVVRGQLWRRRAWRNGFFVLLLLAVSLFALPGVRHRAKQTDQRLLSPYGTGGQRLLIWRGMVRLWAAHPGRLLFGLGPDTLYLAYPAYFDPALLAFDTDGVMRVPDRAHNLLLDTVADVGVLGVASLVVLFFWLHKRLRPDGPAGWRRWGAQAGLLALGLDLCFNFFSPTTVIVAVALFFLAHGEENLPPAAPVTPFWAGLPLLPLAWGLLAENPRPALILLVFSASWLALYWRFFSPATFRARWLPRYTGPSLLLLFLFFVWESVDVRALLTLLPLLLIVAVIWRRAGPDESLSRRMLILLIAFSVLLVGWRVWPASRYHADATHQIGSGALVAGARDAGTARRLDPRLLNRLAVWQATEAAALLRHDPVRFAAAERDLLHDKAAFGPDIAWWDDWLRSGQVGVALGALSPRAENDRYRKALLRWPSLLGWQADWAEWLLSRGETTAALRLSTALTKRLPRYWRGWVGKGDALWAAGDRRGALRAYQEAVRRTPWIPQAWLKIARVQYELGNLVPARIAWYNVNKFPQDAKTHEAWITLGKKLGVR